MADEATFRTWYARHAKMQGLDPNPDAPEHFYDYRAAYRAGLGPDETGHWPSQFKREGHPRLVIEGIDTRTGQPVSGMTERVTATNPQTGEKVQWTGTAWEPIGGPALAAGAGAPQVATEQPAAAAKPGFDWSSVMQPGMNAMNAGMAVGLPIAATVAAAPAAGGVLPFMGGMVKDVALATGAEELAKATGIPGASAVAEVVLGAKGASAKRLLEKFIKERVGKNVSKAAAAKVAEQIVSSGQAPQAVAALAKAAGRAVTPNTQKVMEFVKAIGKSGKKGEKIHVLLDEAGLPIKRLSADQAGAAARAGKPTSYFHNLWGS